MPYDGRLYAMLIPGVRIQNRTDAAFQIGFGGVMGEGDSFALPTISWFRKF